MFSGSSCRHVDAELGKRAGHPNLHCWYDSVCARLSFPTTKEHSKTVPFYLKCSACPRSDRLRCLPLLTCCTSCCTFVCMKHMPAHLRDKKHPLALSLASGHIYCLYCGDFVYSSCIEEKRRKIATKFRMRLGLKSKPWSMKKEDLVGLLRTFPLRKPLEVRGIYNMGNTCFMNCVVQALIHTPLFKPIFTEPRDYCQMKRGHCFLCEVSTVVQAMNENDVPAVAAPRLLALLWELAPHLSGYRQHDAQEFFLAAHDLMHKHFQMEAPNMRITNNCSCIMHRAFDGQTSSIASCSSCGRVWNSADGTPFLDIQLEIPESNRKIHLSECIKEFCKEEVIADYACEFCKAKPIARQTKFKKLPAIMVFHMKRFRHGINPASHTKVSTEVEYDAILDMTNYLRDYEKNPQLYDDGSAGMLERLNNRYSLFAIVHHSGSMQSGHYISYVKTAGNCWFKCDDQYVSRIDSNLVRQTEAYMLFYQKLNVDEFGA